LEVEKRPSAKILLEHKWLHQVCVFKAILGLFNHSQQLCVINLYPTYTKSSKEEKKKLAKSLSRKNIHETVKKLNQVARQQRMHGDSLHLPFVFLRQLTFFFPFAHTARPLTDGEIATLTAPKFSIRHKEQEESTSSQETEKREGDDQEDLSPRLQLPSLKEEIGTTSLFTRITEDKNLRFMYRPPRSTRCNRKAAKQTGLHSKTYCQLGTKSDGCLSP
jgi:hypothetical protein